MSTIDPTIRTSRVFDAVLAVFDRIVEADIPANGSTGDTPTVLLAMGPAAEFGEFVAVLAPEEPTQAQWIQAGPASRDELIPIRVIVMSNVPGETSGSEGEAQRNVIKRLKAIADPVQSVAYDTATGKPRKFDFENENHVGLVTGVSFELFKTDNGYVGEATVEFLLRAQI